MTFKHRDIVIAWMDGADIERQDPRTKEWSPIPSSEGGYFQTSFSYTANYRIKPKDKVEYVVAGTSGRFLYCREKNANLKLTFDAETNVLKSAEVIQNV